MQDNFILISYVCCELEFRCHSLFMNSVGKVWSCASIEIATYSSQRLILTVLLSVSNDRRENVSDLESFDRAKN